MIAARAAALGSALLALLTTPAGAVDCSYVTTTIDETICSDKALVSLENQLDEHYRATLKRLDQHNHDLLIAGQRQWRKDRAVQCANVRSVDDKRAACIAKATHARQRMISERFVASATASPAGKPFEGHWQYCQTWQGQQICGFRTLFQKGDRICGNWHYWATYREYDGRLVWTLNGKAADGRYICGRVGSETSLECPYDDSQSLWQKTSGATYVCADGKGRYLVELETSCRDKPDSATERWHPLTAKQLARPANEGWLQHCLGDADYPDPSTVQERDR